LDGIQKEIFNDLFPSNQEITSVIVGFTLMLLIEQSVKSFGFSSPITSNLSLAW
jgi:hypothetical protein